MSEMPRAPSSSRIRSAIGPGRSVGGSWNRFRYTLWAPIYDGLVGATPFKGARRRSMERLELRVDDRVLLVGAGTGLDIDLLPPGVEVTAIDVTPAMLERLRAGSSNTRWASTA
jgi:hypothetical protein